MRRSVSVSVGVLVSWLSVAAVAAQPGAPADKNVKDLSLEELLAVEVTSVARKAQKLTDSAAAVYVLTRSDIRRSGATTIPAVLRLVPGVQVARIDSNKWAVSVRGFNSRYANKLLVLVDGRTAYSQLYSGVFWETLDLPLDDIERVEVIRGPGGTMWGANAVNGVVNIITTHARESKGSLVAMTAETPGPGGIATARHGWHLGDTGGVRLFTRGFDRALTGGPAFHDGWALMRVGVRADGGTPDHGFSLQASSYRGTFAQTYDLMPEMPQLAAPTASDVHVNGTQFSGALTRGQSARSLFTVRSFVDYSHRDELLVRDSRLTVDVDLQHRLVAGPRHDLVWGSGYRRTNDDVVGTTFAAFDPRRTVAHLFSVFAQDEVALHPSLHLTGGVKFEHSTLARGGWQPSVRARWNLAANHAVWTSASRAIRTSSRAAMDVKVIVQSLPPSAQVPLPTTVTFEGTRDQSPEVLWAYEAGYRGRLGPAVSLDVAAFVNDYSRLTLNQPGAPELRSTAAGPYLYVPLRGVSGGRNESRGVEAALEWHPGARLRVAAAYTRLDIRTQESADPFNSMLFDRDPRQQLAVRMQWDGPAGVEVDPTVRMVSELADRSAAGYVALDIHLGRRLSRALDVALVGTNLTGGSRIEFQSTVANTLPSRVQPSVLASATWRF